MSIFDVDKSLPIELAFKSAKNIDFDSTNVVSSFTVLGSEDPVSLRTFDSYSFERNILVPAAAFRFTAPGVDKELRMQIRSGDLVQLFARDFDGKIIPVGTGFVDETDTHILPGAVDYVISGRDTLGQFVDNTAIDANNKMIAIEEIDIPTIFATLQKNTRMPFSFYPSPGGIPNGKFLFQTNPGETKINALQRYLEFCNCLIWTAPNGLAIIGKPDFAQATSGQLIMSSENPVGNNVLEARVRRAPNLAIRQIVVQLQALSMDPGALSANTVVNSDADMQEIADALAGRSVYQTFSYGQGNAAVNQYKFVGNQNANPNSIGTQMALREIAKENMKILDVEVVVPGHFDENGNLYNVDTIYDVQIDDEDIEQEMYVYHVNYELTREHGILTRMRLCEKYSIVSSGNIIKGSGQSYLSSGEVV